MKDADASARYRAAWPGTPVGSAKVPRRRYGLAALSGIVAAWEERIRFRWQLEQMSKANPHLIDDIGLTIRQVEAESAKPFWRV